MDLEVFKDLPREEQKKNIMDHRHFLGEEKKHYVGYGEAVLDFFGHLGALNIIDVSKETIMQLQEPDEYYHHCCTCGYIFRKNFDEKNRIGFLSKTLGLILITFNISSSLCNPCLNSRLEKRKLEK